MASFAAADDEIEGAALPENSQHVLKRTRVLYGVNDRPVWYMCFLIGFQHYIIMFGACVANILVLAPSLCITPRDTEAIPEIVGTTFFCCGIATLLQSFVGVRIPIIQGGSFTYIAPIMAVLSREQCPVESYSLPHNTTVNVSNTTEWWDATVNVSNTAEWRNRMCEVQGAIMVASLLEIAVGFSGVLGFILQWIGPLVVTPTVTLIGLDLFDVATELASKQYWVALVTVVLIAMFSQYTRNIKLPFCDYNRDTQRFTRTTLPLFLMLPVLLAVLISWLLYTILVYAGQVTDMTSGGGNMSQFRLSALDNAPWFNLPYPGKHGAPRVRAASIVGVLAGVIASMVESVGDYYACARMSNVRPPPLHAINRGIGVEGIGSFMFGAFGCGTGTTSYSESVGAIGINKVASRTVIHCAAAIMIVSGIFTKFGVLFVKVPEPVIGGVFIVMFGMVTGIGLSNLQFVNMNSTRNLFIIGFSFFFGIQIPKYVASITTNNIANITGNTSLDEALKLFLGTSMLVGGLSAFILDNTIPGTRRERGLLAWKKLKTQSKYTDGFNVYDLPMFSRIWRGKSWSRFVPFLPSFDEKLIKIKKFKTHART